MGAFSGAAFFMLEDDVYFAGGFDCDEAVDFVADFAGEFLEGADVGDWGEARRLGRDVSRDSSEDCSVDGTLRESATTCSRTYLRLDRQCCLNITNRHDGGPVICILLLLTSSLRFCGRPLDSFL